MFKSGSVICPGEQAMFENEEDRRHFLRVAFMAYWQNTPPSAEVFYLSGHKIHLNPSGIGLLEQEVSQLLRLCSSTPLVKVTYITYSGIEMTEDEVFQLGWRMITG